MKVHDQNQQVFYDRRSSKDRRQFDDNIMPPNMRNGIDRRQQQIGIYVRESKGAELNLDDVST